MDLNEVKIYRITHIENIPHILQHGITHKKSVNRNPNFKNIGDISLIETRSKKSVIVDNGEFGEDEGKVSILLGNYIPFYFGVKMPMLYVAQHGGNFVEKPTPPCDIVYMACSLPRIIRSGIEFFFTDGHATDMLTSFYDKTKVGELINIIDWSAVKSAYWGGADNLNIKRKKQAEFLIHGDVSSDLIIGFVCFNDNAKTKLLSMGVADAKIKVIPNAYY